MWVALGLFGAAVPASFLIRAQITRQAREAYSEGDIGRFKERYQASRITSWALFEGPGFFGVIAYMLTGHDYALGVACACIALLVMTRPTEGSLNALLEDAP